MHGKKCCTETGPALFLFLKFRREFPSYSLKTTAMNRGDIRIISVETCHLSSVIHSSTLGHSSHVMCETGDNSRHFYPSTVTGPLGDTSKLSGQNVGESISNAVTTPGTYHVAQKMGPKNVVLLPPPSFLLDQEF